VAAENIQSIYAFKKEIFIPMVPRHERHYHMFLPHKTHAGDTALYITAGSGYQDMVTVIYRFFCHDWLEYETRVGTLLPAERPVEFYDHEEESYVLPLVFLLERNNTGRDAQV
jgi:hypothetical protein